MRIVFFGHSRKAPSGRLAQFRKERVLPMDENYVNCFIDHMVKGESLVSFMCGQPLGYYASWVLFALSHHFLMWLAAEQVYTNHGRHVSNPSMVFRLYGVDFRVRSSIYSVNRSRTDKRDLVAEAWTERDRVGSIRTLNRERFFLSLRFKMSKDKGIFSQYHSFSFKEVNTRADYLIILKEGSAGFCRAPPRGRDPAPLSILSSYALFISYLTLDEHLRTLTQFFLSSQISLMFLSDRRGVKEIGALSEAGRRIEFTSTSIQSQPKEGVSEVDESGSPPCRRLCSDRGVG
ncbi:putative mitochondrial protein [Cucumis melo var. makuwa]|nr:putative mitochondrial protein [Cucumis melo var. makuwa]